MRKNISHLMKKKHIQPGISKETPRVSIFFKRSKKKCLKLYVFKKNAEKAFDYHHVHDNEDEDDMSENPKKK